MFSPPQIAADDSEAVIGRALNPRDPLSMTAAAKQLGISRFAIAKRKRNMQFGEYQKKIKRAKDAEIKRSKLVVKLSLKSKRKFPTTSTPKRSQSNITPNKLTPNDVYVGKMSPEKVPSDKSVSNSSNILEEEALHSCKKCDKTFKHERSMDRHFKIHHNSGGFPCPICQRTYSTTRGLRTHIGSTHERDINSSMDSGPYPCTKCDSVLKNKRGLVKHLKGLHNSGRFYCPVCQSASNTLIYLKKHMAIHSPVPHLDTESNPHVSDISLHVPEEEKRMESGVKSVSPCDSEMSVNICVKCVICNKTYFECGALNRHIKKMHQLETFICDTSSCRMPFISESELSAHKLSAHGEGAPELKDCPFSSAESVKGNEEKEPSSHDKEHQCGVCGMKFAHFSRMKIHMKSHSRNYKCSMCSAKFENDHDLRNHLTDLHKLTLTDALQEIQKVLATHESSTLTPLTNNLRSKRVTSLAKTNLTNLDTPKKPRTPTTKSKPPTKKSGSPTKKAGPHTEKSGTPTENSGPHTETSKTPTDKSGTERPGPYTKKPGTPTNKSGPPTAKTGPLTEKSGIERPGPPTEKPGSNTKKSGPHTGTSRPPTEKDEPPPIKSGPPGINEIPCEHCDMLFDKMSYLNSHLKSIHHTQLYLCSICRKGHQGSLFLSASIFREHLKKYHHFNEMQIEVQMKRLQNKNNNVEPTSSDPIGLPPEVAPVDIVSWLNQTNTTSTMDQNESDTRFDNEFDAPTEVSSPVTTRCSKRKRGIASEIGADTPTKKRTPSKKVVSPLKLGKDVPSAYQSVCQEIVDATTSTMDTTIHSKASNTPIGLDWASNDQACPQRSHNNSTAGQIGLNENSKALPAWLNCRECLSALVIPQGVSVSKLLQRGHGHITKYHNAAGSLNRIYQCFPELQAWKFKRSMPSVINNPKAVLPNNFNEYKCNLCNDNFVYINYVVDETKMDNEMINHAAGHSNAESLEDEVFHGCFPVTAPQMGMGH